MKNNYIILDWAGNDVFNGKEFKSFDDAYEFLSEQVEYIYPETANDDDAKDEQMGEYEIEEA